MTSTNIDQIESNLRNKIKNEASFEEIESAINQSKSLHNMDSERFSNGRIVLETAIEKGRLDVVKLLIEKGVNIKEIGRHDRTPLHEAASHGAIEIVKFLLIENEEQIGKEINVEDRLGYTALSLAAHRGHTEVVRYLIEKQANLKVKAGLTGATTLHLAIYSGKIELVKLLLDKGADINEQDKEGATALHRAMSCAKIELIEFLIKNRADINIKDQKGHTALYEAKFSDNIEAAELLIAKGAKINKPIIFLEFRRNGIIAGIKSIILAVSSYFKFEVMNNMRAKPGETSSKPLKNPKKSTDQIFQNNPQENSVQLKR